MAAWRFNGWMDNVGIVVESLDAAISFFAELGLELEGRGMIEGEWSGRVTGLRDERVEIVMTRMLDGHGKIELSRFLTPPSVVDHRNAPANALGYLRVMFAVDDLDDTLARLQEHGAQLVDEVVHSKTCIGSATSEASRAFSPRWPSRSVGRRDRGDGATSSCASLPVSGASPSCGGHSIPVDGRRHRDRPLAVRGPKSTGRAPPRVRGGSLLAARRLASFEFPSGAGHARSTVTHPIERAGWPSGSARTRRGRA